MIHRGISLAPGVAVGRAFRLEPGWGPHSAEPVKPEEVAVEIARFEDACKAAESDLEATAKQTEKAAGPKEAEIFRAHRALVRDPFFVSRVRSLITDNHWSAEKSVSHILEEFEGILKRMPTGNHSDRVVDLRDVLGRILSRLHGRPEQRVPDGEPVVLIAGEFLPSFAYLLDLNNVVGLITETGGATSHGAILARAMGIPAVSGVRGLLNHIQENDLLAVDGREGRVHLNPGPERVSAFRKLIREYRDIKDRLIENKDLQPVNPEGVRCELLANVNSAADARMASQVGADGVGLYRTEYLFLNLGHIPDEEEQYQTYREVIEASPNKRVTIRTIDVGGDKQLPLLAVPGEANPFMGFRSIRMVKDHPEFFRTQIRAILRAAVHGDVSLLFPMISQVEEVRFLRRFLDDTIGQLVNEGVPHQGDLPIGIMIEVPSAAVMAERFAEQVDFFSIGTNDLTQYTLAMDRGHPKLAPFVDALDPSVLRMIDLTVRGADKHGKWVGVCGGVAGDPQAVPILVGLGVKELSVSIPVIPSVKAQVRTLSYTHCQELAQQALNLDSAAQVRDLVPLDDA